MEALAEAEREHELEAEPEPEEDEVEKIKPKKIPNQFNFCERAALTYDNPMRACIFSSIYQIYLNIRNFCTDIENKSNVPCAGHEYTNYTSAYCNF